MDHLRKVYQWLKYDFMDFLDLWKFYNHLRISDHHFIIIHNSTMNMHNSQMNPTYDSSVTTHPVQYMPGLGIHNHASHTMQTL